ncbi:MAG: flavodoxin family protein [Spirochaetaceae bacterium]|jgi:multimeric flavodoxin WrbA|nr:flavodoxin family protein [Spirochaetaceae bacterium]
MRFLVISGNPKDEGLCRAITGAVLQGARDGGAEAEELTVGGLERCRVCGDGWGVCREQHRCAFESDGFGAARDAVANADALCIITPVYWGEMAEGVKSFLDRLRRCEASKHFSGNGAGSALAGKQTLLVASPGGSGNGALSCLEQMDRFCRHTGAVIFDYISVNRWNGPYKKEAAYAAARAIAGGRRNGDTVPA